MVTALLERCTPSSAELLFDGLIRRCPLFFLLFLKHVKRIEPHLS